MSLLKVSFCRQARLKHHGVFEIETENRLNREIPTVWLPQNDCVAVS